MFWHLTLASAGRRPLVKDERTRRLIIHKIAQVAGGELVLFCVVDEHLHLVTWCLCRRAGRILQALQLALRPLTEAPIEARPKRPVEDRSHLLWLVRYVLTQLEHHDVGREHPALYTGSCFQDLVGARIVDGLNLKLAAALPRYRLRAAYELVGLPPVELQPMALELVREAGPARIVAAVATSQAVGPLSSGGLNGQRPRLEGNRPTIVRARRTALTLARLAGVQQLEMARALGISTRAARKLVALPPDAAYLRAARLRLALEEAVIQVAFGRAPGGGLRANRLVAVATTPMILHPRSGQPVDPGRLLRHGLPAR